MSEDFENIESNEIVEQGGESQEIGELNQMTHEPGDHIEANRTIEDAELLETAFNEVIAGEIEVLPIPVPMRWVVALPRAVV